jgi:hypothetical protein
MKDLMNKKVGIFFIAALVVLSVLSAAVANADTKKVLVSANDGTGTVSEQLNLLDEEMIYYYDPNTVDFNALGLQGGGPYVWETAIRLTSDELADYAGWNIIGAQFYHHEPYARDGKVYIYDEGTPAQPGSLLETGLFSIAATGWHRVDFTNPVTINGDTDLWVSIEWHSNDNDWPASVDAGPAVKEKGDWLYMNNIWQEIWPQGFNYNFCIAAIVDEEIQNPPKLEIGNITGSSFKVNAEIKNTGDGDATDVQWEIALTGEYIFHGKTSNGTMNISAGETKEIQSDWIFGFGGILKPMKILTTAEVPESSDTKDTYAKVFLFFIEII